jgi:hypothetical protein
MLSFKQYLNEAKKVSAEDADTVKPVKGKKKVDQGTKADMKAADAQEKKLELMNGKVTKVKMEPTLDQNINLTGRPK